MKMICTLVCPEEGFLEALFLADSKESLIAEINDFYEDGDDDKPSLLQMLDSVEFKPGSYELEPVEPHWRKWVLLITEERASYLG